MAAQIIDPEALPPEAMPLDQDAAATSLILGDDAPLLPPLEDSDFLDACRRLIQSATDYVEAEVHPELDHAWRYYHGEVDAEPMDAKFRRDGTIDTDPETGQPIFEGSKVVITECWDTVQSILPDMYRMIAGADEIVKFKPAQGEDASVAQQVTDYAHYVFWEQNDGEELLHSLLVNWAVKFGALRVWWDEKEERNTENFSGWEPELAQMMAQDPTLEIDAEPYVQPVLMQQMGPMGPVTVQQPLTLYRGKLTRIERVGQICVEMLPQEDLILDGDAQKRSNLAIVGTRGKRRVTDVVAAGIPLDVVEEYKHKGAPGERSNVALSRDREGRQSGGWTDALDYVDVADVQIRYDRDGDGIAECYHIIALGDPPTVVHVDEGGEGLGYIIGSPFERPHRIIGYGIVEKSEDLQDSTTALTRGVLNNLNHATNSRPATDSRATETYEDLESKLGGVIRLPPGANLQWWTEPFVGDRAYPLLEMFEGRRALRTGITPAGQGLDADALKGQTLESGKAIVTAPQTRVEYFARRFVAEVIRPLFKEILRLSVLYQDKPTMMRLRNEWVTVDPRSWNAKMDAVPAVGLGSGTRQERLVGLQAILGMQKEALAEGLDELVSLVELSNSAKDLTAVFGMKDTDRYFKVVTPDAAKAFQAKRDQARQQAEQAKIEGEQLKEQIKMQARVEADRLMAATKLEMEQTLAAVREQSAKDVAEMKAVLETRLAAYEHERKMWEMQAEFELDKKRIEMSRQNGADGSAGASATNIRRN